MKTGDTPNAVDGALKYLVFLVDADVLFDIALGMYDFGLVLLVAQHAKKVLDLVPAFDSL
jgi:elongator complex protein 1